MPTHRIVPAPDQDEADALIDAIDALEGEGAQILFVQTLDQPLPRKQQWLIVTAPTAHKVERR